MIIHHREVQLPDQSSRGSPSTGEVFPPRSLLFVYDLDHPKQKRVEVGRETPRLIAEMPDLLPTMAVDLIVEGVRSAARLLGLDEEQANALMWSNVQAMTEKLQKFKDMDERHSRTFG